MNNVDRPPHWLKPAALAALIGTIVLVVLILMLVMAGIADPVPLGTLSIDNTQPVELVISSAGHKIYQPTPDAVHCPCTIDITLRQTGGASVEKYGLWWRASDVLTVAALNGNGYYAIFESDGNPPTYLVEWRRFSWLLLQGESNKLRVDLGADSSAAVRINDEIAATFTWNNYSLIEVGFYLETSEGAAAVTLERFRIWSSTP